jgi:hypothetical protein
LRDDFKSKVSRKLIWIVIEKKKNNYYDYNAFKRDWNPSMKFFTLLKNEMKSVIKEDVHKIRVVKRTLFWPFNRK